MAAVVASNHTRRRGNLRSQITNRRIWLKSVIIPSLVILLLFLGSGWWAIRSLQGIYYEQRFQEAALTADSYSQTISLALDAQQRFEEALATTLEVAVTIIDDYPHPLLSETLTSFAHDLHVDVVYLYDPTLTVVATSDATHLGRQASADDPARSFAESSERTVIEEIRPDATSGLAYRYAFHRKSDGSILQIGINADRTFRLYEDFTPQHIIEELSRRNPRTRLALVDNESRIIAATDSAKIGEVFEQLEAIITAYATDYRRVKYEQRAYLLFRLPIPGDDQHTNSLVVLFDLSTLDWLIHWISVTITLVLLLFFVFFLRSFWRVHRLNRQVLHSANHDELTGLGNLRLFNQTIRALKRPPCALLVINPVNFKRLNMLYGYTHGDEVLIKLADRLRSIAAEREGWSAYRLSDDRFLLLAIGSFDQWQLTEVATAIIADSIAIGLLSRPTLAIGVAQKKDDGPHQATLLKQALIALDSTTGANPIQFYNIDLESCLMRTNTIELLLKRAIDGEEGLITLHFQPIVACATGTVVAYEALARLTDSELGNISPDEFIPIAERHQLITPLGMALFPMALSLIERLRQEGITDTRIAINVSALQLLDDNFMNFVRSYLSERAIGAEAIELELTESAFIDEESGLIERLSLLRSLGISLSIDDFGSGYSSLSRLRSLPFDTIKLGRPFIQQVEEREHAHFVSDIISMAHHIDKRVVAEGVETEMERARLMEIGCDFLQGYLLGRPLTLAEVLEEHRSGARRE